MLVLPAFCFLFVFLCGFVCFVGDPVPMLDLENFFLKSVNVLKQNVKFHSKNHDFEVWKIVEMSPNAGPTSWYLQFFLNATH